jgi:hypothetical protein
MPKNPEKPPAGDIEFPLISAKKQAIPGEKRAYSRDFRQI